MVPLSKELLDELLGLVDRLTMQHRSTVSVETEDGGEAKVTIKHEPLLDQLRAAIWSEKRNRPGAGGIPSERNVIDSDALEQYEKISRQITRLYRETTSAAPFASPTQNLRSWFVAFKMQVELQKVSGEIVHEKLRKVGSMVAAIETKLNPPTILEITAPCPRCGVTYGNDKDGVYRRAVVIESRVAEYKSLDNSRARCVACGAVWVHGRGMRQLRWEIDQVEETRHADANPFEQIIEQDARLGSAIGEVRPKSEGPS